MERKSFVYNDNFGRGIFGAETLDRLEDEVTRSGLKR